MARPRPLATIIRAIALVAVCVAPLLLLETCLRVAGVGESDRLFVPSRDPAFLATNPGFTSVYFRPGLERTLKPGYIRAAKRDDTYRIFVLGASAAAGFPDHRFGFSRKLAVMLEQRFPDLDIEVVSLATAAINSHVVRDIAKRAADHAPDLFVVYLGNNEVIGPFGPTAQMSARIDSIRMIRVVNALNRLRVTQWLKGLLAGGARESWRGLEAVAYEQIPRDDPQMDVVYRNFRQNLEDLQKLAVEAGARVLLSTVAVNTRDFAPFGSQRRPEIADAEAARFQKLLDDGSRRLARGDWQAAEEALSEAARIDPGHAGARYQLGRARLGLADETGARGDLVLARDLDAVRLRADSRINEIVEQVAVADSSGRVTLVDAASQIGAGLAGDDLLLEHVHFGARGNDRLARIVLEAITPLIAADTGRTAEATLLSPEQVASAIVELPRAQVTGLRTLARRVERPPFRGRYGNRELLRSIEERIATQHETPLDLTDSLPWLRARPDDLVSHQTAAAALLAELRAAHSAGGSERLDELLGWARALDAISGENGDVDAHRARWAKQFEAFE